jgi:hypothetical protein
MYIKKIFLFTVTSLLLTAALTVPANASQIFVRVAPPRPVVERVVPRPGVHYVWVGGFYRWSGRAYVWMPGHWVYPPRPAAVWVPAHWQFIPARRGYVFVAGYWR